MDAPRSDVAELVCLPNTEVVLPPAKRGLPGWIEQGTASDWRQAWITARCPWRAYLSLSEKVGLPLALMDRIKGRQIPHVLIAHRLTSPRKRLAERLFPLLPDFARIIVLSRPQEHYLLHERRIPRERVQFLYDWVDTEWWQPGLPMTLPANPIVLSVGQERRDYATLQYVARYLPEVLFVVAASSPWSQNRVPPLENSPHNVIWRSNIPVGELRELYRQASVVVVPLQRGTDYAAGVNALLEGMAMAKPVVVSETPGLEGYLSPETVRIVPPQSVPEWVVALEHLLTDSATAQSLAQQAHRVAKARFSLERYILSLKIILEEVTG
ncbi:MAG: hypothetical protein OHK0029_26530 [Armatimonadaceae bacterium]